MVEGTHPAAMMALASADAAIQAAQAAVRAAHAILRPPSPPVEKPRCIKCGSNDLRDVMANGFTHSICGNCGAETATGTEN